MVWWKMCCCQYISTICLQRTIPSVRLYSRKFAPIKMAFDEFSGSNTDKNVNPLIIMHGLFGSKQNWRGVGRALALKSNRTIFTVDARNHGDSPHTEEHSSMHMAADVAEFIADQGFTKSCIMGHSMGGRSMMYLALKNPEIIERAIIVDISPIALPRDFKRMEQIFTAMKNISVTPDVPIAVGRALVEQQIKSAVEDKGTVDFIMMNLRKRSTGEFFWAPNVKALHSNLRTFSEFAEHVSHLPPFNGKMSFICGKYSNFVDPDHWPKIQRLFPNSEIHWLETGHLVHFEQPAKFMNLVIEFLKK